MASLLRAQWPTVQVRNAAAQLPEPEQFDLGAGDCQADAGSAFRLNDRSADLRETKTECCNSDLDEIRKPPAREERSQGLP